MTLALVQQAKGLLVAVAFDEQSLPKVAELPLLPCHQT